MKLYVYDHCPFCVRARMIFGLKNLPVELVVLANDDEATPIGLVGKKVVPILVKEDGTAMPESLDIVHYVDEHFGEKILSAHVRPEIEAWLKEVSSYYGHLTTARFTQIGLAEFETQSAVDYFTKKKTEFIGDFAENIAKTETYLTRLKGDLKKLAVLIQSENALNANFLLKILSFSCITKSNLCERHRISTSSFSLYHEYG